MILVYSLISHRYGLVSPPEPTAGSASSVGSADVDWYDAEMSLGDVFYTRTSMLGLSDILNRVSSLETEEHEIVSRRHSRERLLRQLSSSPHRYMVCKDWGREGYIVYRDETRIETKYLLPI